MGKTKFYPYIIPNVGGKRLTENVKLPNDISIIDGICMYGLGQETIYGTTLTLNTKYHGEFILGTASILFDNCNLPIIENQIVTIRNNVNMNFRLSVMGFTYEKFKIPRYTYQSFYNLKRDLTPINIEGKKNNYFKVVLDFEKAETGRIVTSSVNFYMIIKYSTK